MKNHSTCQLTCLRCRDDELMHSWTDSGRTCGHGGHPRGVRKGAFLVLISRLVTPNELLSPLWCIRFLLEQTSRPLLFCHCSIREYRRNNFLLSTRSACVCQYFNKSYPADQIIYFLRKNRNAKNALLPLQIF